MLIYPIFISEHRTGHWLLLPTHEPYSDGRVEIVMLNAREAAPQLYLWKIQQYAATHSGPEVVLHVSWKAAAHERHTWNLSNRFTPVSGTVELWAGAWCLSCTTPWRSLSYLVW